MGSTWDTGARSLTRAHRSQGARATEGGLGILFLKPIWEGELRVEGRGSPGRCYRAWSSKGTEKIESNSFMAQRSLFLIVRDRVHPRLSDSSELRQQTLCLLPRLRKWGVEQQSG